MTAQIQTLIDKVDTFELVRDKIALILFEESAQQEILAVAAGEDPEEYKLRIFTERSNPIETFLVTNPVKTPLVNVSFDSMTFPEDRGDVVERQMGETVYNLDIYGYGESSDVIAGGHTPGDREAAFEVQRAIRLVRNILMSSYYTYLDLRKTVEKRWPLSITSFQPEMNGNAVEHVMGARISFGVDLHEFSPQYQGVPLDEVFVDVKRSETGLLVLEADYIYP